MHEFVCYFVYLDNVYLYIIYLYIGICIHNIYQKTFIYNTYISSFDYIYIMKEEKHLIKLYIDT